MRCIHLFLFFCILCSFCRAQTVAPDKIYTGLFTEVQMRRIFPDGKTFVDCIPKKAPEQIEQEYKKLKSKLQSNESLALFIKDNFTIPKAPTLVYKSESKDVVTHINRLWKVLQRKADTVIQGTSLLSLPFSYLVPGGRFREIYYWDSYFTMLGLKESNEVALIENIIKNYAYLIDKYGHIPNGNRTYYLSRSQPPFFSLMIQLLASIKGDAVYATYQKQLEKEYDYWMDKTSDTKHIIKMPDGSILNRYYDQLAIPRQESFYEDSILAKNKNREQRIFIYRSLRSAAESGWDFSSRWFSDGKSLATIQTTNLIPVDLNCLLYHLEKTLATSYTINGANEKASLYTQAAEKRKNAINKYCWSQNWYVDYNHTVNKFSPEKTLAGMFPFYLQLADSIKMNKAIMYLQKNFLKSGGVVTTLKHTGQQWDAPNGWAPLQWITIIGLDNYAQQEAAKEIAAKWVQLNKKVFAATGKLMEKYDVISTNKKAGGGEYPSQDGFGWTNGVLLALINKYGFK